MISRKSNVRRPFAIAFAAATLAALATVSACSGNDDSSDDSAADSGSSMVEGSGGSGDAAAERSPADSQSFGTDESNAASALQDAATPIVTQDAAIIRTGAIELTSDDVGRVLTRIKGLVLTSGGRISSEDTATDDDGQEVRSRLELQVPVEKFEQIYDEIPTYATLVDTKQSAKDVTAQVADIDARVRSQQDSIDQLRRLFSEATKLGDIIALERELSQRQADLEALQAQQRSLQAQTTFSTILVGITEPDPAAIPIPDDSDQAGFVAGIKSGWDGLITFVVGLGHFVGLVLPIGCMLAVTALVVWLLVRRFIPRQRHPGQPQPSE